MSPETVCSVSSLVWRCYKARMAVGLVLTVLLCYLYRGQPATPRPALSQPRWTWRCDPVARVCLKTARNTSTALLLSQAGCSLRCSPENFLWPLPSHYSVGEKVRVFSPSDTRRDIKAPSHQVEQLLVETVDWQIEKLVGVRKPRKNMEKIVGSSMLTIEVNEDVIDLGLETSEHYTLQVMEEEGESGLHVIIRAETYFGARHGLETLFQLVQFDHMEDSYLISADVNIEDGPHYPHRGVMLDTARNFISVDMIKTLIDSMSYSKLNVFHWHITDSQSFPLYLDSLPEFAEFGAYSPEQSYSKWEVEDLVRYATKRGVRVLPEFDSPAHVGAGWEAVDPSFTVCVNRQPWDEWCVEPPCGQLNPASSGMYSVLGNIFADMINMFGVKQFHMGGDEIHVGCWNSSSDIVKWLEDRGRGREEEDFMFLWSDYLKRSVKKIKEAGMTNPNLVYWTNGLTKPENIHHLDPKLFTIQIWSNSKDFSDNTIKTVAEKGFKMIFSNYDATYLDCGFGGWVNNGNNWCSPYKEWQLQHQNDLTRILEQRDLNNLAEAVSNVMGGEVALWTEQADGHNMMQRIEPRAAAYGERLWRGPRTGGWREAERRLVRHRERLVRRGVSAETLTHGWCRQNEGKCILNSDSFK